MSELLELDAAAGLLELGLELVGLVALDALLDRLWGLVDERLGLLQAQAGRRADDLDHLDLLVAGCGEDDVDGGRLLLGRGTVAAASARGGGCRDRGRADAELLFERLDALGELEHGNALELLDPISSGGGHRSFYSSLSSVWVSVGSAASSAPSAGSSAAAVCSGASASWSEGSSASVADSSAGGSSAGGSSAAGSASAAGSSTS